MLRYGYADRLNAILYLPTVLNVYTSSDGQITETDIRAFATFDDKKKNRVLNIWNYLQLRALNQTVHSGTEQRFVRKRKQINPSWRHFKNKIYRTTFSRWCCVIKYLLCLPSTLTYKSIFECHRYRETATLTQNEQNAYVYSLKKKGWKCVIRRNYNEKLAFLLNLKLLLLNKTVKKQIIVWHKTFSF